MKVHARKRFGQHYLHDQNVINRIIDSLDFTQDTTLVEIGPGRGALTIPLLRITDCLHVVEIDRDLADILVSTAGAGSKLVVHREDALKLKFCERFDGPLTIIGNLPYNISTPLLFHMLDDSACIKQMLFMLQREVAERICAEPGSHAYGRLSIMVQSVCEVHPLFNVSSKSFTPEPKVESTVIRLAPGNRLYPAPLSAERFKIIVRTAFSRRRKTIRNALKGLVSEQDMVAVGIDPSSRPEQISVESYISLSNYQDLPDI